VKTVNFCVFLWQQFVATKLDVGLLKVVTQQLSFSNSGTLCVTVHMYTRDVIH
jgi:hypothetical protein